MNLGNPVEFSMLELAQIVIELTGSHSKIIFKPLPSDDPKQRKPDISLAREYLENWTPNIQLREGIFKTIQYFDQLLVKAA
jgi:UDP-glucuronate decarboxylase